MQEIRMSESQAEAGLIDKEKLAKAVKRGARMACDELACRKYQDEESETLGYLECLSDLGLI